METRRQFLGKVVKGVCAACLAAKMLPSGRKIKNFFESEAFAAATVSDHEALHYVKMGKSGVECRLCPWGCKIADGSRGLCGVRENKGGTLRSLVYGKPCTIHTDPIEKAF